MFERDGEAVAVASTVGWCSSSIEWHDDPIAVAVAVAVAAALVLLLLVAFVFVAKVDAMALWLLAVIVRYRDGVPCRAVMCCAVM